MTDEMDLPGDAKEHDHRDEDTVIDDRASPGEDQLTEGRLTEVAVIRVDDSAVVPWRKAALAVRAAAPQLIRNPVVVGASAAVATVAVRLAIEAAARALGGSAPSQPRSLEVTGSILHDVRVVRHVHVIHHVVHHYPYSQPFYGSRQPRP
ncbi:MAG TPA: hypothetical protein VLL08_10600 [Kineosporiaceae bacterium]|nr:hypothetical protein [Kineosporiaceae bacterium]